MYIVLLLLSDLVDKYRNALGVSRHKSFTLEKVEKYIVNELGYTEISIDDSKYKTE